MLDYLIPIAIAVVGIVVMVFIFQSISKAEVSTGIVEAARKPRSKKSQRPSRKYSEDVLDLETEQLIAREVARGPTGMITDTKMVAPTTLDSIRNRRQAKEESQHVQAVSKLSDRQKQSVKEQGFTFVEKQKPAAKQQQQQQKKQQRDQEPVTSTEELEKKLSLFFKSSGSRKMKEVKPRAEEGAGAQSTNRGTVTMKADIGGAKGWPFKGAAAEPVAEE